MAEFILTPAGLALCAVLGFNPQYQSPNGVAIDCLAIMLSDGAIVDAPIMPGSIPKNDYGRGAWRNFTKCTHVADADGLPRYWCRKPDASS